MILALLVHLVFFGCLWIGVSWRSDETGMVEAEVWDISLSQAAPRATASEPAPPEPEPQAAEEPVEKTPEVPEPKVDPNPDIALEKEKKLQEEKKKAEEQKKAEERRKVQEEQRRQQALADQKRVEQLMAEERERLAARSGAGGTGTAQFSAGQTADAGYIQLVGAKIKSNTIFNVPEALSGNPPVEYAVELLPDGSIKSIVKRKTSGVPGFDDAVFRAIEKSAPFPRDRTGRVPPRFDISHRPKG